MAAAVVVVVVVAEGGVAAGVVRMENLTAVDITAVEGAGGGASMVGMAARPQHLGTVVVDTGVAVAVVEAVGSTTRHSTTNHRSTHRRSPRRPTMSIRVAGAAGAAVVVALTVATTDIVAVEAVAVEAVRHTAAAGHHMGTTTSINTASRRKHGEARNNRASHIIVRGVTNIQLYVIRFVKTA